MSDLKYFVSTLQQIAEDRLLELEEKVHQYSYLIQSIIYDSSVISYLDAKEKKARAEKEIERIKFILKRVRGEK